MTTSISTWVRGAALGGGAAVMVAMAPGIASAGTVSETVTVPSTATTWASPVILNFAGFTALAPAGQTLDSVNFELTETMTGTGVATNNSDIEATGDFVITNTATVNLGTFGKVINEENSATVNINPGATSAVLPISGSATTNTLLTTDLAQFLPAFTGSALDSGVSGLAFNTANLDATFTDFGALSVTVTYTYSATPVPEPASMALLAMGLLGLGFVKFKRA